MFHKYNSFSNSLTPTDQLSAYVPDSLGNKQATNNFYIAPQPKGRQPGGTGPESYGSIAGRQMTFFRFLTGKTGSGTSPLLEKAQEVASTVSKNVSSVTSAASNVASNAAQNVASATSAAANVAQNAAQNVVSVTSAAANAAQNAVSAASGAARNAVSGGHGHGHHSHAAPWEGVNLWRTPYKGDTDTITQVKRSKGALDKYVEERTRHIQKLQIHALRTKSTPTWIIMPRDKILYAIQGAIAAYVIYASASAVYQNLKAKDRLKLVKLLYKDNVD